MYSFSQSCRTGGVSAELDYIETYINVYPDSALSVLQNINEDLLHGRSIGIIIIFFWLKLKTSALLMRQKIQ